MLQDTTNDGKLSSTLTRFAKLFTTVYRVFLHEFSSFLENLKRIDHSISVIASALLSVAASLVLICFHLSHEMISLALKACTKFFMFPLWKTSLMIPAMSSLT